MIKISNLTKKYDKTVLDSVSLSIAKGKICGLFGVNGAGKSTLLKILCGLEKASNGKCFYNDKEIIPGVYPIIGAMIESPCFYPNMTGYENLHLLSCLCPDVKKENIINALNDVGLISKKDVLFKKYSLGMKQRLYFASAIMRDSDILLLDEPFNGIDPIALNGLEKLIKKLAEKGKTIIISSHAIRELQVLVDKAVFLDNGKIIFDTDEAQSVDIFKEFVERINNKGDVK